MPFIPILLNLGRWGILLFGGSSLIDSISDFVRSLTGQAPEPDERDAFAAGLLVILFAAMVGVILWLLYKAGIIKR